MTPAQLKFLAWLEKTDPVAYDVVATKNATELGAWEWLGTAWNGIKSAAGAVAPALKEAAINTAKIKAEQKLREKYLGGDKSIPITNAQISAASEQAAQQEAVRIQQQSIENKRVIDLQIKRADQGLGPIQTPTYIPTVSTRQAQAAPGIIPQAAANTTRLATVPLIIGGGAALIALVLIMMKRR